MSTTNKNSATNDNILFKMAILMYIFTIPKCNPGQDGNGANLKRPDGISEVLSSCVLHDNGIMGIIHSALYFLKISLDNFVTILVT